MATFSRFLSYGLLLTACVLLFAAPMNAAPHQVYVSAPDGVQVAVQEYGNPQGLEIVLVHGLDGSHLDWVKQISSPLLSKYRLITYDLRGHGFSSKPADPRFYADGKRWGDELHAVIAAKHLKHPVLVGWSLGGPIITNYLETYGDAHIAGIVFVDGAIELKPELLKAHPATIAALTSTDFGTYLEGTRQFVRECFFTQPSPSEFALLYAGAAEASPDMVRQAFRGLSVPAASALPKVSVPALYIYGERDDLIAPRMVTRAKQLLPHLQVVVYPETGHASFFEQPERFNQDLERFVQAAAQENGVADAGSR